MREAIADLAAAVTREVGLAANDILDMTVVGNPIMHHLFLGLDPTELGGAPFALTIDGAYEARASAFGLPLSSGAYVYVLPCIAGHVGADTAGVVLSEGPYLKGEVTLVVDVGTNAEIVLGNRDRLLACSSPTGPAFEGAQISSGQRAAPGAIERVRIDKATLEPRFKVIGSDLWSDEPGFAAAVAATGVTGICGSGIIEAVAEMLLAGLITPDGVVDGAMAGAHAAHRERRPHLPLPPPRGRAPHRGHPERHPRHPARQGGALCRDAAAHGPLRRRRRSIASRSPAPSAAISTSPTRWCSASCRTATSTRSPRPATPRAPGRASRSSTHRPARRSRASCAGSRRSRRRSSPPSRRISWAPWRSRTRSDPFPHLEAALGVTFGRGATSEGGGARRERRRARATAE